MLKNSVPYIVLFLTDVFFIMSAFIGYTFKDSESSLSYIIFNVCFFALSIAYSVFDLVFNKQKIRLRQLLVVGGMIFPIFLFSVELALGKVSPYAIERFGYYILWGISSSLMGMYLSLNERYKQIFNYLDIFMWMINIALIRTLTTSLIENVTIGIGGETYQKAGYIFALAFGINFYLIIFGNKFDRIQFFESKFIVVLNHIFLWLQFIGVLATGARGPMLLLIVYLLAVLAMKKKPVLFYLKSIFIIAISVLILMVLIPTLENISLFNNSLDRVFEYITPNGINWEATSGRDSVYREVIDYILKKPITGYGFFSYLTSVGYTAHNLFFEILLQGGILLLFIVSVIFIYVIRKLLKILRYDKYISIYFILFLYPLVTLMFSSVYYYNSYFCFFISFIISYSLNDNGIYGNENNIK